MGRWQDAVIVAIGEAAGGSGVLNETAGRIYAALYLSAGPLSLGEICEAIGASKATVSVQVRELLELGMVRKVWVRRSRRDYYEAATDLWTIATEVIGRRLEREVRTLLSVLDAVQPVMAASSGASSLIQERVTTMRVFLQMAMALLEGFRRGETMRPDMLRRAGD
ncbi:MAG: GbsR/MarR family transcriptional regulator [Dehalococcoidia bacterium]